MKTFIQHVLSAVVVGCTIVAVPAAASATHLEAATEETAKEARQRLVLADKQRVLVEEMAELSCLIALNVDNGTTVAKLAALRDQFETVMAALRGGDPALGISGEEHYSKVIRALDKAQAAWAPYNAAVDAVIAAKTVPSEHKPMLFEGDYPVLDALSVLVSTIESAYANPSEMQMADAVLIDLVGRQEAMTQAIGKDVCLLVLGWEADLHRETLVSGLSIFDATHNALRNGLPAMGIKPAPTPEIAAALDAFAERWAPQRNFAERVLGGEKVEGYEVRDFLQENLRLLQDMDAILELYQAL